MIIRNGAEGMDVQFRGTRMNSVWSGGKLVWPTWHETDFFTWANYWDPERTWNKEDWKVTTWDPAVFRNVITGWTLEDHTPGTAIDFSGGSDLVIRITATRHHDIVWIGRLEAHLHSNTFSLPAFDGWETIENSTGAFKEGIVMNFTTVNGMAYSLSLQSVEAAPAWSRSESKYRIRAYVYWGSLGSVGRGSYREGTLEGLGVRVHQSFEVPGGLLALPSKISGIFLGRNGSRMEPLNAGQPFALSDGQVWIPSMEGTTAAEGSMQATAGTVEGFRDKVRRPGRRDWAYHPSEILSSVSFTSGGVPYVADFYSGGMNIKRNPLQYSPDDPLPYSLGTYDRSWNYYYGIPMSEYNRLQEEGDG